MSQFGRRSKLVEKQVSANPPDLTKGTNASWIPLQPGTVIEEGRLLPSEKEDLLAAGIDISDGVPDTFVEVLEKARQEIAAELENPPLPVSPDHKLPSVATMSFNDLPEEKKAELREAAKKLNQEIREARESERLQQESSSYEQGISEAVQIAEAAAQRQNINLQFVDDRDIEPAPKDESEPDVTSYKEPEAKSDAGSESLIAKECKRCGWDQSHDLPLEPTERDKIAYISAIGGGKPFMKDYAIFGGSGTLTFRELTMKEIDLTTGLAYEMVINGELKTEAEYRYVLSRNQLSLQLVRLRLGENVVNFPMSFEEWLAEDSSPLEGRAKLAKIVDMMMTETPLRTSSVYRTALRTLSDFISLVGIFEARSHDPNFWAPAGKNAS